MSRYIAPAFELSAVAHSENQLTFSLAQYRQTLQTRYQASLGLYSLIEGDILDEALLTRAKRSGTAGVPPAHARTPDQDPAHGAAGPVTSS